MTTLTLSVPTVGQPNSTEDPKIATSFNAISTWAAGNIDTGNLATSAGILDTQLSSPGNGSRRLVMQSPPALLNVGSSTSTVELPNWTGSSSSTSASQVPLTYIDSTLFTVANKTTTWVLRMSYITNSISAGTINLQGVLASVVSNGGTAGTINYTITGVQTTTSLAAPGTSTQGFVDTSPFTGLTTGHYALGWELGLPLASNSAIQVQTALYVYYA